MYLLILYDYFDYVIPLLKLGIVRGFGRRTFCRRSRARDLILLFVSQNHRDSRPLHRKNMPVSTESLTSTAQLLDSRAQAASIARRRRSSMLSALAVPVPAPAKSSTAPVSSPSQWSQTQEWRVKYKMIGDLCIFRTLEAAETAPRECCSRTQETGTSTTASSSSASVDWLELPLDIIPLIARYLHDCELLKLSATAKAVYRATYPEFVFRASRIISTSLNYLDRATKPRKFVAEEHEKMEALANALNKTSSLFVIKTDYSRGFPRAVAASGRGL